MWTQDTYFTKCLCPNRDKVLQVLSLLLKFILLGACKFWCFLARESLMPLEVNSYAICPHQGEREEINKQEKIK